VTEIRRILREEDPRDPSAAVEALNPEKSREVAALRSCDPQKLPPLLRGDLDRIVMMAMEKDRQRRYGSADALAADLWRYLHDEPVMARPSSRLYRLRRLVRRNKVVFAAGSMVMATLIAGFGTSTWLFMREKQAREEQTRLRSEAEAARTEETKLRGQAEAREACAQAAVKLSYGQIEQADELLASIPSDMIPSSLEAADAYREVGEWHRKAGRIQQAAERFTALAASISAVDRSDIYQISFDLLPAAVATCKAGDWSRYEQVRQIGIERYGTTQSIIVAEQIIKTCTLRPATAETMAKIARTAAFLEDAAGSEGEQGTADKTRSWAFFSLALWYHRLGDHEQVLRFAELSLQQDSGDEHRVVCVRCLMAMARFGMGDAELGRTLLADASESTRAMIASPPDKLADDIIVWVGWGTAQILQEEAEAMIGR
jgi:tetratricopeptide (TPR) repeat protein